jgi:hypothetical protein
MEGLVSNSKETRWWQVEFRRPAGLEVLLVVTEGLSRSFANQPDVTSGLRLSLRLPRRATRAWSYAFPELRGERATYPLGSVFKN